MESPRRIEGIECKWPSTEHQLKCVSFLFLYAFFLHLIYFNDKEPDLCNFCDIKGRTFLSLTSDRIWFYARKQLYKTWNYSWLLSPFWPLWVCNSIEKNPFWIIKYPRSPLKNGNHALPRNFKLFARTVSKRLNWPLNMSRTWRNSSTPNQWKITWYASQRKLESGKQPKDSMPSGLWNNTNSTYQKTKSKESSTNVSMITRRKVNHPNTSSQSKTAWWTAPSEIRSRPRL